MSRMKTSLVFSKPDEIEASVTITLSVADWKIFVTQVEGSKWPGWEVRERIRKLIAAAEITLREDLRPDDVGGVL